MIQFVASWAVFCLGTVFGMWLNALVRGERE